MAPPNKRAAKDTTDHNTCKNARKHKRKTRTPIPSLSPCPSTT